MRTEILELITSRKIPQTEQKQYPNQKEEISDTMRKSNSLFPEKIQREYFFDFFRPQKNNFFKIF